MKAPTSSLNTVSSQRDRPRAEVEKLHGRAPGVLEGLLSEEDQFGGCQCNADFLGEFAVRCCRGRFSGPDVAAGWRVEAAEIGVAGARAGLQ